MIAPPAASRFAFDVVGLGEISVDDVLLVDAAPRAGEKVATRLRERIGGGQIATAMVAARRLGLRAAVVGVVGDDEAGRFALEGLRAEGVDVRGVRQKPGRTRTAVLVVDARGERTVLCHRDPRVTLEPADLDRALLGDTRVLHVDGTFPHAALAAARIARAAGAAVSSDFDEEVSPPLLGEVDLAIVSERYVAALAVPPGRDRLALAARETATNFACVTHGERGARAIDGGRSTDLVRVAAPAPIIDTTACGDTFRAGFLAAFLDGRDLADTLAFACAAAALKTRDLGRVGCPTRAEVEALLASTTATAALAPRRP